MSTTITRTLRLSLPSCLRHSSPLALSPTRRTYADLSTSNYGTKQDRHVTNKPDELNVHSSASASGKRQKATGDGQSSATSERDPKNDNERAQKDHPEAPGPVIGMNDERGPGGVDGKAVVVRVIEADVWCRRDMAIRNS
ncbi:MAG: hypothetical protein M1835_006336 [Candelina submexicana]|nr:MAG: hypothetical protein M1835_006336 [Candelina submexicana]